MNIIPLIIFIALMLSTVLFFINIFFINKPVNNDQQSISRIDDLNNLFNEKLGENWPYTLFFICILFILIFYLLYLVSKDGSIIQCDGNNLKFITGISVMFMLLFLMNLFVISIKVLQTQSFTKKNCINTNSDGSPKLESLDSNDKLKILGLLLFIITLFIIAFVLFKKFYKK